MIVVTLLGCPGFTLPLLLRAARGARQDEEAGPTPSAALARRARQRRARRAAPRSTGRRWASTTTVGEQVLDELRARFARLGATLAGDDAAAVPAAAGDEVAEDYRDRLAALRRRREQWSGSSRSRSPRARREVLAARAEPGVDPEVADRVLRRLDVRTSAMARV